MDLEQYVLDNELAIRLAFFLGVFAIIGLWEVVAPRRALTVSKAMRWGSNLSLVVLNTLLLRLVELNARRAAEEAAGTVRWLRPAFQQARLGEQAILETGEEDAVEDDIAEVKPVQAAVVQRPWPTGLTEQIKAVAEVLSTAGRSLDLEGLAAHFNGRGRWRDRLPMLLDTLVALGRARAVEGRWVGIGG